MRVKDRSGTAAISRMPNNNALEPIEHQRLRLLFRQAHAASIVASLSAVACTAVFLGAAPGPASLVWLGAVLLVTALRFQLFRRFFRADIRRHPEQHWLRRHGWTAALAGIAWGSIPLISLQGADSYVLQLQTLIPGFVLMAAITSYGVYFSQYLVLWASTGFTTISARLYTSGLEGSPEALLFALFLPALALTAKRYADSLVASTAAKYRSEQLVQQLTATNDELHRHNATLARQQDLIEQEEALAKHVFRQLILGGDHKLAGIHCWNQSMGSLSGDLTQTARGPSGQAYVFLGDFTGHGLPAALGALPASSVFLAMAAKGLPVQCIAAELNKKLRQLLPVGYFCCAVLVELSADRRTVHLWNGGLPPILVQRRGAAAYEEVASNSVPLGVLDEQEFEAHAYRLSLHQGDLLYAYTDGLTEAENIEGQMWGIARLQGLLMDRGLAAPKLPALIEAVMEHVNLAPPSDDISVVEIEATPAANSAADAA